jgi:NAD-dependent DNA ligase
MEKNLSIEKNWRLELQADLNEKVEAIKSANEKLEVLNQIEQENKFVKEERDGLVVKIDELEKTLEEMGSRLGMLVFKC